MQRNRGKQPQRRQRKGKQDPKQTPRRSTYDERAKNAKGTQQNGRRGKGRQPRKNQPEQPNKQQPKASRRSGRKRPRPPKRPQVGSESRNRRTTDIRALKTYQEQQHTRTGKQHKGPPQAEDKGQRQTRREAKRQGEHQRHKREPAEGTKRPKGSGGNGAN